jgi:transcription elongation factor Elf1
MEALKAVSFLCPGCGGDVKVTSMLLSLKWQVCLAVDCEHCNQSYAFPLKSVLDVLVPDDAAPGSKMVN